MDTLQTDHDRTQAQIAKLLAEISHINQDSNHSAAQMRQMLLEDQKTMAETKQINQHMKWYVPILFATGGAGLMTIAILISRFLLIEYPAP